MLTTIIHLKVEITTQPDNTMKQRGGESNREGGRPNQRGGGRNREGQTETEKGGDSNREGETERERGRQKQGGGDDDTQSIQMVRLQ